MSPPDWEALARDAARRARADPAAGAAVLEAALAEAPDGHAGAWNDLGILRARMGDGAGALAAFDRSLALAPDRSAVIGNRANALATLGDRAAALAAYDAAIAADPDRLESWLNKAATLARDPADRAQARRVLSQAARRHRNRPQLWRQAAHLARAMGDWRSLAQAGRVLSRLVPREADGWLALGHAWDRLGRLDAALKARREALRLAPDAPTAMIALAQSLLRTGSAVEARALAAIAAARDPKRADAHFWLGNCELRLERPDRAIQAYRRAGRLEDPGRRAGFAEATARIQMGDLAGGWRLYESRFSMPAYRSKLTDVRARLWRGDDLTGKTLLVHAEQGHGDMLMFARYLPLIKPRFGAGRVLAWVEPTTAPLIEGLAGVDAVLTGEGADEAEAWDWQVPVMSLPDRFAITPDTIPADVPYLAAPPGRPAPGWAQDARLKVGIAWAGRPGHADDRYRSMPLARFAPLLAEKGVLFVALQLGAARAALKPHLGLDSVIDHGDALADFGDTAAAVMALDLVITVDTALAHLAGALARPVWTLLPMGSEWRWGVAGTETPWYPTMRLYRQSLLGDWDAPILRVRADLKRLLAARATSGP